MSGCIRSNDSIISYAGKSGHHVSSAWQLPAVEGASDFRDADVRYQTLRASGPGGQHVNKTDRAVRATHMPTGLSTLSHDQRSQFANKKIARLKLAMLFDAQRRTASGRLGIGTTRLSAGLR